MKNSTKWRKRRTREKSTMFAHIIRYLYIVSLSNIDEIFFSYYYYPVVFDTKYESVLIIFIALSRFFCSLYISFFVSLLLLLLLLRLSALPSFSSVYWLILLFLSALHCYSCCCWNYLVARWVLQVLSFSLYVSLFRTRTCTEICTPKPTRIRVWFKWMCGCVYSCCRCRCRDIVSVTDNLQTFHN